MKKYGIKVESGVILQQILIVSSFFDETTGKVEKKKKKGFMEKMKEMKEALED